MAAVAPAGMGRKAGAAAAGARERQSVSVGKLNLVDLAGSERVHITGATGAAPGTCHILHGCLRPLHLILAPAPNQAWTLSARTWSLPIANGRTAPGARASPHQESTWPLKQNSVMPAAECGCQWLPLCAHAGRHSDGPPPKPSLC